jgi:hypothetical protein
MQARDYLQKFEVTEAESKLRILICCPKPIEEIGTHLNYQWAEAKQLPKLAFPDQSFNLALCCDILFIDPAHSTLDLLDVLTELARIAGEVRVYPVIDEQGNPSQHLGPVLQALQQKNYGVELRGIKSDPSLTKGALLRLWNPSCAVPISSTEFMNEVFRMEVLLSVFPAISKKKTMLQ